jgi:hypothetical protein
MAHYTIVIHTSKNLAAGTDARIKLRLEGTENTEELPWLDPAEDLKPGSYFEHYYTSTNPLGYLKRISIMRDAGEDWGLAWVKIQETSTMGIWFFRSVPEYLREADWRTIDATGVLHDKEEE